MRILILAATNLEIEPLTGVSIKSYLPVSNNFMPNSDIDFLVTGIGAVPTTFYIAQFGSKYDLILNIGIAGSFNKDMNIGSVVLVSHDCFGDLGIDNNGAFVPLFKAGIDNKSENPISAGFMSNPWVKSVNVDNIRLANGITVGTTSGSKKRIEEIKKIWNPDIETMESAAVFYSCLNLKIPFICIRAISNMVEPRNKSKWEIHEAIDNLCDFTKNYIPKLINHNF